MATPAFSSPFSVLSTLAPETLDAFITSSHECWPPEGADLSILTSIPSSTPTSSSGSPTPAALAYRQGPTQTPMAKFSTPFKDKSIPELHEIFKEGFTGEENRAQLCFVILDERTVRYGTALLVTSEKEMEDKDMTLQHRCEASIVLELLVGWEICERGKNCGEEGNWDLVVTAEWYRKGG